MTLSERIERVGEGSRGDNALDVLVEVALFTPKNHAVSVRPNSAGTKVIYTYDSGEEETFWARDWTIDKNREGTIAALKARGV